MNKTKDEIQAFWDELERTVYPEAWQREELCRLLADLQRMFQHRRHLAVVEMPLSLAGKDVLEIGSGSGATAALFALHGARMTAIDIAPSRVEATRRKLELLDSPYGPHRSFEADAERLPFPDNRFDIVYANGVLHHTPDTERAIAEIYRVLKPGGKAAVMVYARWSFQYLVSVKLIEGWFGGNRSEWMSEKPQTSRNPILKAYSVREVQRLFARFQDVKVRKAGFQWPWRRKGRLYESGKLLYGAPWRAETPFEQWAGRYVGFDWNISARK